MTSVALGISRCRDAAEDIVQNAFEKAVRNLHQFDGRARFSTWLHRIVVNASLMKIRSRSRRPEALIDDLLPGFLEDGHLAAPAVVWETPADDSIARREPLGARPKTREKAESSRPSGFLQIPADTAALLSQIHDNTATGLGDAID